MALDVRPLTATLGADVSGVDMADVDGSTLEALHRAWLDYKVLVLRDQNITTEEHIAFGRLFGDLEVHPFAVYRGARTDHPEVVTLRSDAETTYSASVWHSDVTWREAPSMGSVLRAVEIPPVGGDTCFADATAAYDRLPDAWKSRVDDLVAVHDFTRAFGGRLDAAELAEKQATYPAVEHPVVRTHPATGARGIYTNRSFTSHVMGVDADESTEILRRLERAIMDPSVQCRIRWEVDTFVMWDNRAVQHFGTNDFYPETRHMERVSIVGDRPV